MEAIMASSIIKHGSRNNQLAPWVTTNLTAVELDRALQNHITKIMNHYRGKLYAVDVVVRFLVLFFIIEY